jgi:hypothetical protein
MSSGCSFWWTCLTGKGGGEGEGKGLFVLGGHVSRCFATPPPCLAMLAHVRVIQPTRPFRQLGSYTNPHPIPAAYLTTCRTALQI